MAFLGSPGETGGGGVIRGNLKGTFKGLKKQFKLSEWCYNFKRREKKNA